MTNIQSDSVLKKKSFKLATTHLESSKHQVSLPPNAPHQTIVTGYWILQGGCLHRLWELHIYRNS